MKEIRMPLIVLILVFNLLSISNSLAATCPIKPIGVSYFGTADRQVVFSTAVVQTRGNLDANDQALVWEGGIAAKTNLIQKKLLSNQAAGELQGVIPQGSCRIKDKLYVTVMLDDRYAGVASKAKSDIRRSLGNTSQTEVGSATNVQQSNDFAGNFERLLGSPPEIK